MAGRPRRTAEIPNSGTKKAPASTRKSRIAQPINRTERNLSTDRYSYAATPVNKKGYGFTPSTARTHQTPNTPSSAGGVGYSRTKLTMTGEKKSNDEKSLMLRYQSRIVDFLIAQEFPGYGVDYDVKNFKSITFKSFIALVAWLLEQIGGDRLKIEGNFVDDIHRILIELDFPFKMNKSVLKTPTAAHSFHQIVIMLNWMVDLVDPCNCIVVEGVDMSLEFVPDPDFPSTEYQKTFFETIHAGFQLWDQQKDDEFQALKDTLVDKYVQETTNFSSKKSLEENLHEMQAEKLKLENILKEKNNFSQLADLDDKVSKKFSEIQSVKIKIEIKKDEEMALKKSLMERGEILSLKKRELEQLKATVESQTMTIDEKRDLIMKNLALKSIIEEQERQIVLLQNKNLNDPVELSRLMKVKSQKIMELNLLMYEVQKFIPEFNATVYEIDPKSQSLTSDLQIIEEAFLGISQNLHEMVKSTYSQKMKFLEEKAKLEINLMEKKEKLNEIAEKVLGNNDKIGKKMEKTLMECESLLKMEREYKEKIKTLAEKIKNNYAEARQAEEDGKKIEAECKVMMQMYLDEADAVHEQKKQDLAEVNRMIAESKVEHEYLLAQEAMYKAKILKLLHKPEKNE